MIGRFFLFERFFNDDIIFFRLMLLFDFNLEFQPLLLHSNRILLFLFLIVLNFHEFLLALEPLIHPIQINHQSQHIYHWLLPSLFTVDHIFNLLNFVYELFYF
jgi:hypothetical protein